MKTYFWKRFGIIQVVLLCEFSLLCCRLALDVWNLFFLMIVIVNVYFVFYNKIVIQAAICNYFQLDCVTI